LRQLKKTNSDLAIKNQKFRKPILLESGEVSKKYILKDIRVNTYEVFG